jgi:xeroderma pigmentosum group C-complementing protein
MLAEADARDDGALEDDRPRKRLKLVGPRATSGEARVATNTTENAAGAEGDTAKRPQIVYNSPSEGSDESDMEWEEVDIQQPAIPGAAGPVSGDDDEPLQITLGQQEGQKRRVIRRKPVTAAERKIRLDVHKTHLLCLLSHVQRRNLWCNDEEIQVRCIHKSSRFHVYNFDSVGIPQKNAFEARNLATQSTGEQATAYQVGHVPRWTQPGW